MKQVKMLFFATFLSLVFLNTPVIANPFSDSEENDKGRYVFQMMTGRAIKNTRIPAVILDSVQGIVWTCQNLQDGKPLWVKTDLGQNGGKSLSKKKYIVKMLVWQDADLRMPAVVLDTEEGIVWTCPNIIDGKATWIQKDLKGGAEKTIPRNE